MTTSNAIGWYTLLFLAVLALAMAIAARCDATPEPRPFVARLIAAQRPLQSRQEASVDPAELAEAIAAIPGVTGQWAALVLTIAAHESTLRARIARGECKPTECDHGRAWGLYQIHKNKDNAGVWGSPDLRLQTTEAARMLRSAFYQCGALQHPDWVIRTLRAYAGRGCGSPLRGEADRFATYERIRGRL